MRKLTGLPMLVVVLHGILFLPTWQWYVQRMLDGSDEPWGILALGTALAYATFAGKSNPVDGRTWWPLLGLASVYLLLSQRLSELPSAILAMLALSVTINRLRFATVLHLPLVGLLLLSLPVIASLQFYAGFPLRLMTAHCAAVIISALGYPALAQGTVLQYAGELIAVDAPCSGVKMLWSTLYAHFTLAACYRLSGRATWIGYLLSSLVVFLANVLRASLLFFVESGIVSAPTWAHQGIGLAIFFLLLLVVLQINWQLGNSVKVNRQLRFLKILEKSIALRFSRIIHRSLGTVVDRCGRSLLRRAAYLQISLTRTKTAFADLPKSALILLSLYSLVATGVGSELMLKNAVATTQEDSSIWPTDFQGSQLYPLALTEKEAYFSKGFPGAIARFSDGEREILIRHVRQATRQLHPAIDCLRGVGFNVTPLPLEIDSGGQHWSCQLAVRGAEQMRVCEQIVAADGQVFSDVSTWFWSAVFARSVGPWRAYTVAERV